MYIHYIHTWNPNDPFVLVGKDPVLEGLSLKIEDKKVPGKYAYKCTRYLQILPSLTICS